MNRISRLLNAAVIVTVGSAATLVAQSARFGVGGGLTTPMSDYKNLDKTGWHVMGNVEFGIPLSPVGVRVDGIYGQASHQDSIGPGNTKLIGGLVSVVWKIPVAAPILKPYLIAGGGFYSRKLTITSQPAVDTTVSKFTFGVGGGVRLGVGPARFFAEARYVSMQTDPKTTFVPITVGINFGSK
jgi:Outer membrane protein beta-barrel domain